jgi:hypothetical protein
VPADVVKPLPGGIPDPVREKALRDAAAGGTGTAVDITVTGS